jgi:hypothetical protein
VVLPAPGHIQQALLAAMAGTQALAPTSLRLAAGVAVLGVRLLLAEAAALVAVLHLALPLVGWGRLHRALTVPGFAEAVVVRALLVLALQPL